MKKLYPIFSLILLLTLNQCDSTEPPEIIPKEEIKNTITLSVEWRDLNSVKIKFTKSGLDTLNNFTYKLKLKSGTEITYNNISGSDTSYVESGLAEGEQVSYKIEAYNESKLKDTSKTLYTKSLRTTSHNITWQVNTLGQAGNFLDDVWGLDENNVWAVGAIETDQGITAVLKWNGVDWKYHSWPEGGGHAIYGFSENDIWLAGEYSNRGYVAHFDGTKWTEYKSDYFYARGDTVYQLRGIWGSSPTDVWAVGRRGTIIHWDGKDWKKSKSPVTYNITDIWGVNSNDILAVTFSLTGRSKIIKYDGKEWRVDNRTNQISGRNLITIWIDKTQTGYVGGNKIVELFPGGTNQLEINQQHAIMRIRGENKTNIFVTTQKSVIHHYNGKSWHYYNDYVDESNFNEITGIQVFENRVFLSGYGPNGVQLYRGVFN